MIYFHDRPRDRGCACQINWIFWVWWRHYWRETALWGISDFFCAPFAFQLNGPLVASAIYKCLSSVKRKNENHSCHLQSFHLLQLFVFLFFRSSWNPIRFNFSCWKNQTVHQTEGRRFSKETAEESDPIDFCCPCFLFDCRMMQTSSIELHATSSPATSWTIANPTGRDIRGWHCSIDCRSTHRCSSRSTDITIPKETNQKNRPSVVFSYHCHVF